MAGHIAAATARFQALLVAFDASGGWQQIGVTSCAQWLSWKCGLSPTTAREHLRVAKRLVTLPAMAGTFAAGALSYSKVRALTRMATPGTEADLIGAARTATAEQLQRLRRGLSRARTLDQAVQQQASAAFTHHWDDDGTLCFSGRLPAEAGALLLRAIASQREQSPPQEGPNSGTSAPESAGHGDTEALVRIVKHALDTPPGDCSGGSIRLIVHTSEAALAVSGPLGQAIGAAPPPPPSPSSPSSEAAESIDERPGVVIESGHGLLPETVQRLACDAILEPATDPDADEGEPASKPRRKRDPRRFVNRRQRDALIRRDAGCRFSECTRVQGVQVDHMEAHAVGGPTTMANLAHL